MTLDLIYRGERVTPESRAGRRVLRRASRLIDLLDAAGARGHRIIELPSLLAAEVRVTMHGPAGPWAVTGHVDLRGRWDEDYGAPCRLYVGDDAYGTRLGHIGDRFEYLPVEPRQEPALCREIIASALFEALLPPLVVQQATAVDQADGYYKTGGGFDACLGTAKLDVRVDGIRYSVNVGRSGELTSIAQLNSKGHASPSRGPVGEYTRKYFLERVDAEQFALAMETALGRIDDYMDSDSTC